MQVRPTAGPDDRCPRQSPHANRKRNTAIHLQLQPGESRILRAMENKVADEPHWPILKPSGEPLAVNGPWKIRFLEGGPVLPASATMEAPGSWTETADPEARRFAGTASYTTSFTLPAKADRWLLDLGDVRESARVRINGKPAGMVIAHPFRLDVTDFLKDGPNTIEIEVTNLSANRIRDLDQRKVGWKKFHDINIVDHHYKKFDASAWPIEPSGLLGPVTLFPMTDFGNGHKDQIKKLILATALTLSITSHAEDQPSTLAEARRSAVIASHTLSKVQRWLHEASPAENRPQVHHQTRDHPLVLIQFHKNTIFVFAYELHLWIVPGRTP
jgi:hypothetical protein